MRRGAWHQCGDRSQRLVEEQLEYGSGVGVILSPRDLGRKRALIYAERYRDLGAQVLIDHQFYVPDFTNPRLDSYPISSFRAAVSSLGQLSDRQLAEFQNQLRIDNARCELMQLLHLRWFTRQAGRTLSNSTVAYSGLPALWVTNSAFLCTPLLFWVAQLQPRSRPSPPLWRRQPH